MGCFSSKPDDASAIRRRPASIGEVAVFVPGLRVPEPLELPPPPLADCLPRRLTERLAVSRTRIASMAAREALAVSRPRWRAITQHGGSTSADLVQALEEYLPVVLGMTKDGSELEDKIQFAWMNQEDDAEVSELQKTTTIRAKSSNTHQIHVFWWFLCGWLISFPQLWWDFAIYSAEETALPSAWYEVLSVVHMMAMLRLSQANSLLLPKTSLEGYHTKVSEENKRASVEVFLKAAGHLECAMQHVLPRMSPEKRKGLPVDLSEGVLRATCMQALGQAIDVQLGLAIDSPKATLAVKRRLACEMVKCWQQAHESIGDLPLLDGWGEKHRLFVKWKHIEAKAAAYYYHGLILDEGNSEKWHRMAVAALLSAEELLRESRTACEAFHAASPVSRSPVLWGSMKYLHDKIHKDSSCKVRINKDLYSNVDRTTHETAAPALPDFVVALKPEEYRLPLTDSAASAND